MKKYIYILLFISISANSQEKALLTADKKFKQEQYIQAVKIYEQLAKKGVASVEIYERLGDSYYFNANYEKAFVWYQKLYELNANCSSEYLYRYAQCLKSTGNYDLAKTILEKYSNKEKLEIRADLFKKFNGKANTDDRLSKAFNVMNLDINSTKSDYGGIIKGDTIVFASARNRNLANRIYKRTNQSFTNLYYSTIKSLIDIPEPKLFSKNTSGKASIGSVSNIKSGSIGLLCNENFMMKIQNISSIDTFLVRHPVLRAGKPIESCVFDGDNLPSTKHFGLFVEGKLVGVVSVFKNNNTTFNIENQFQIRGMAVLQEFQKRGFGKDLVKHCEELIKNETNTDAYRPSIGLQIVDSLKTGWYVLEVIIAFIVQMWSILLLVFFGFIIYRNYLKK